MSEKLTIALTGRRPIWNNEYEGQANRTWRLRVRQHAHGRAVYATNFQNGQTAVVGSYSTPERMYRRQSTG